MIVRTGGGYRVKSEGGKNLSRAGLSEAEAKKRLRQVEYFKHRDRALTASMGGGKSRVR